MAREYGDPFPSPSPVDTAMFVFVRSALSEDLTLCATFLDLDGRNFHCWAHRMWVAERMGLSAQEEFDFTTDKIKQVHPKSVTYAHHIIHSEAACSAKLYSEIIENNTGVLVG